ncbi:hypothetical protein TSAR_005586, partial [Trichomalopsis sarcophagae]
MPAPSTATPRKAQDTRINAYGQDERSRKKRAGASCLMQMRATRTKSGNGRREREQEEVVRERMRKPTPEPLSSLSVYVCVAWLCIMATKSRGLVKTTMKNMRYAYAILGNDMGYVDEDGFTKFAKYSKITQCCLSIACSVFVVGYVSVFGFPPHTSSAIFIQLSIPLSNICFLSFEALINRDYSLRFSNQLRQVKLDLIKYRKYIDTSKINYYLFFYQILGLTKAFVHIFNYVYFNLCAPVSVPVFFVIWFLSQPLTSIMLMVHCCSLSVFCAYYDALNKVCSILNEMKFKEEVQLSVIKTVGKNYIKLGKTLNEILCKQKYFVKYFFALSMARVLFIEYLFIIYVLRSRVDTEISTFFNLFDVLFNGFFTVFCIAHAYEIVNAAKANTKYILEEVVVLNQALYSHPSVRFYVSYLFDRDPPIDTGSFLPINHRIILWLELGISTGDKKRGIRVDDKNPARP